MQRDIAECVAWAGTDGGCEGRVGDPPSPKRRAAQFVPWRVRARASLGFANRSHASRAEGAYARAEGAEAWLRVKDSCGITVVDTSIRLPPLPPSRLVWSGQGYKTEEAVQTGSLQITELGSCAIVETVIVCNFRSCSAPAQRHIKLHGELSFMYQTREEKVVMCFGV